MVANLVSDRYPNQDMPWHILRCTVSTQIIVDCGIVAGPFFHMKDILSSETYLYIFTQVVSYLEVIIEVIVLAFRQPHHPIPASHFNKEF